MNEWEWQLLENKSPVESVEIRGSHVGPGDRVRLCPRDGGDIFDIALKGKVAVVESIEQDYEGKFHLSVVVEEDPGLEIGLMRQPGHRFFFSVEEVELLPGEAGHEAFRAATKKILVAGVGNIFLGDDGFGVEVAKRLAGLQLPPGVRVADFGIRGFDLAYALMEGYDTTILVDAYPGNGRPGDLFVVEPDLAQLNGSATPSAVEPHAMNPMNVIRMATEMGGELKRILLVGCVPATFGPDEGQMGLSSRVAAAVDEAVTLVTSLIARILAGKSLEEEGVHPQSKGDVYGS